MKHVDDLLNCQELGGQKKKECTYCCKQLVAEIKRLRGVIHRTENALHKLQLKYLDLHNNAEEVMVLLEKHGGSIVPHLLDTDENAGERLRQLLAGKE